MTNSVEKPLNPRARIRHSFQLAIFGLILTGLTVGALLWGPFLWDLLTDQERFKAWVESYGAYAAFVFIAAQFVQVVIFFIPGEVTQLAGGYIFGTWLGLLFSYFGITLGSVTAFALARLFEHTALDLLVDRQTVRKFDRLVYGKSGFWPLFILFLIPGIPKDLLCYIAGLTPMHVVTFLAVSTIGRFPGILLASIFGDGLAERDWTAVGLSTGIALGLLGIVYLLRKPIERFRKKYLVTEEEQALMGNTVAPCRSGQPTTQGLKVSRKPDEGTSQLDHDRVNRGVALITYLQREVFGFYEENDAQSKEREQPKRTNQDLAADQQERGQEIFCVVGERRKK